MSKRRRANQKEEKPRTLPSASAPVASFYNFFRFCYPFHSTTTNPVFWSSRRGPAVDLICANHMHARSLSEPAAAPLLLEPSTAPVHSTDSTADAW